MRRPSTWKILGLMAASLAVAAAGIGLWIHFRIQAQWEAMVREVDALLDHIDSRPSLRRPSDPGVVRGNAWEDYLAAGAALPRLNSSKPPPFEDPLAYPMHRLLEGTRRANSRFPYPPELRRECRLPNDFQSPSGVAQTIGGIWTRSLFDQGKSRTGIDLLMDMATFGVDLADRAFDTDVMDGYLVIAENFRALHEQLRTRTFSKEDLLHLAGRLERLDRAWPDHETALRADLAALGLLLILEDREGEPMHSFSGYDRIRRDWRTLYSSRLHALRQYRKAEAILRQVSEMQKLPAESAQPALNAIRKELMASRDPLFTTFYHVNFVEETRRLRAQGRLMQMAARAAATGGAVELEDPMGGTLRVVTSERRVVVRRIAAGSSSSEVYEPPEVVLELDRK